MKRYLIVGLGNPGKEYERSRHNVGFMLVDYLSKRWGIPLSRARFHTAFGVGKVYGKRVVLIKPQVFMNNSGISVAPFARFYKLPLNQLLIIHDDVDLELGIIRLRAAGSSAGHHGMESIIEELRGNGFPRLRIGIGRPTGKRDVTDYVLEEFKSLESQVLENVLDRASKSVESYLIDGIEMAMSRFNGHMIGE
ncbi:MAG TPA: aminoacyl-tRNA hydrolase [Anaerolineae bacterium]|nr:aminoacyl-tRNA hydrolase [Anaerolineae bacterium]